jgi:hypothetical protein
MGQSWPQARQHHFIVTEFERTVCSGRTRPMAPHCGHFSGNRMRRGLRDTGEVRRLPQSAADLPLHSLLVTRLESFRINAHRGGGSTVRSRRDWSRITQLTDELARTQAESADAQQIAERIKREVDAAKAAVTPLETHPSKFNN